ncbi:predicted protein [Verticillium alfalfae VaMs.102]|uniref:Predicted protein n=1 Tax=Verticillium alfalfae (strain VaMs.102 / ATCC MYA-4576 / FGSC 10136) TaxID=526221 RepID=C9SXD0_VERA1|nr:predicted protein [Verticillium alfalfae VaMs.102]EEY23320.1 predicted protein [Verticillium alfalfae VaMs.102]
MAAGVPAVGGSGGKAWSWSLSRSVESASVRLSCFSEYSACKGKEGVSVVVKEERRAPSSCSSSCWSSRQDWGASCSAGSPRRLLSRSGSFRGCEVSSEGRERETLGRFGFELGTLMLVCWFGRGGGAGGSGKGGDNGDAVGGLWEIAKAPGSIPSVSRSSVVDVGKGASLEDRDEPSAGQVVVLSSRDCRGKAEVRMDVWTRWSRNGEARKAIGCSARGYHLAMVQMR